MKNIFFYLMAALGFLFNPIEGAEKPPMKDLIPFHVINETWHQKTELKGLVIYENTQEEFSLILDEIVAEEAPTQKTIHFSSDGIKEIGLLLQNYREPPGEEDDEATLITTLPSFKPTSSLEEIRFIIHRDRITPQPTYLNPVSLP
jgi:hypothetical protein